MACPGWQAHAAHPCGPGLRADPAGRGQLTKRQLTDASRRRDKSAGAHPGVTRLAARKRGTVRKCRFRLRVATGEPILAGVIGAGFGTTLAEARDGNEAAFGRLFRDLQPALLRYLQVLAPQAQADGSRLASEPRRA